MKSRYTRARLYVARCVVAVAALMTVAFATPARAQNVILNPATIQGSVSLTGQSFNYFYVNAYWTDNSTNPPTNYSASTFVQNSSSYSLIVNVPQGSSPSYTVYVYGYLNGSGQYYYFNSQSVTPDPGNPQTVNFAETPGYLQGTVTANGGTLNYFYVYSGSNYGYFSGTNTYSLVVHPGTNIFTYGYAYDQYGGAQFDQGYLSLDVAAGQTVTQDWTVTLPGPPPVGEIDGTFGLNGSVTPTYMSFAASGSSYNSTSTSPFAFTNLNAGSYYLYSSFSFGTGSTYLGLPDAAFSPSRNVQVTGGATTVVSAVANEAFLNGTVTIGGTTTLADTQSAQLYAYGQYQTPAAGGYAGTSLASSGAYSLVLTDGAWAPYALYLSYYKPDPSNYLSESLSFYDSGVADNPTTLAAGDTATKNLTYAMGNVTVNFQALGNATFSNPQLSFSCQYTDPSTQQQKWSYSGSASNSLTSVTQGSVTFTGMAGDCTIQASAYVNGSNYVTFGNLSVTVVPGTIQVIDIGGPGLVVNFPEANYLTTLSSILVTGTANDDSVDIASITVNGNAATFSSTGNPLRLHEVAFSATVPLTLGANTLTTVVTAQDTDVAGKQASDTRTVFYDPGPLALAFTPADGSTTSVANITIVGTASDPAGIQTILVNGSPVAFAPDGVSGEVGFSVPFTLVDGDNFITVVATGVDADDAHPGQTITQTHKVTLSTAPPKSNPVISAVGGSFVYSGSPHAGSGSATGGQGEALPVSLIYTGAGYGPSSLAPVNAGAYQVIAHTDGNDDTFAGDSAPAPLVIAKADPAIVVTGYNVTYDGSAHTATGSATGVTSEALAGLDLSGTTHTDAGSYTDHWTFTDATGNYNGASGSVVDVIAYQLCASGGDARAKQSGSTIPMKAQLCTASGMNVSNASVVLHATGIQLVSGTANGTLQDSGNANPGMNFRLVGPPATYLFNLQTKGFASGSYNLLFTVGSDPTVYSMPFAIK